MLKDFGKEIFRCLRCDRAIFLGPLVLPYAPKCATNHPNTDCHGNGTRERAFQFEVGVNRDRLERLRRSPCRCDPAHIQRHGALNLHLD